MKELTLEITQRCMNNCIYCSSNSHSFCDIQIGIKRAKDIIDEAMKLNFTNINLSGGEPFLYSYIVDLCKYIKTKGLHLTIYSSGVYLKNKTKIEIPYDILKECNPDTIIFNMQSTINDKYNYITNSIHGNYLLYKSIKNCLELNINTEVNFVPMTININEFDLIIDKCKLLGVNKINILKLVNQGRCSQKLVPNENDIFNLLNKARDIKDIDIRIGDSFNKCNCNNCKAGKDKVVIRYDGQVLPCERFKMIHNSNNINNYSLKDCIDKLRSK